MKWEIDMRGQTAALIRQLSIAQQQTSTQLGLQVETRSVQEGTLQLCLSLNEQLRVLNQMFPDIGEITEDDMPTRMAAARRRLQDEVLRTAEGAATSGQLNSTSAMCRAFAAIDMSAHADLLRWTRRMLGETP